jgi:hypothetical protein
VRALAATLPKLVITAYPPGLSGSRFRCGRLVEVVDESVKGDVSDYLRRLTRTKTRLDYCLEVGVA